VRRHFVGAYVLATIELLVGVPLIYGAYRLWPEIFHDPHARLDDWLALAAMALTGAGVTATAAAALFHSRMSYALLRRARIGAVVFDVWMILAGSGIWAGSRRRGGDWVGLGELAGFLFLALGTLLLSLSLIALWYIRRMRPADGQET
jgi:hypothetical protein